MAPPVTTSDDPSVTIGSLPLERNDEAARLLARAFAADPILTHFLNGRLRRHVACPAFFRALILESFSHRHVYAAWNRDHMAGVAVWIPPDAEPPDPALLRRAAVHRALVTLLFPLRARALFRGFEATREFHPHEPHWYLSFVGVDIRQQGRGIGRHLLMPVLRIADRDRLVCYLETPFPETHEFYRRLGFELRPPMHPFRGAPPLWTMIRKPLPSEDLI